MRKTARLKLKIHSLLTLPNDVVCKRPTPYRYRDNITAPLAIELHIYQPIDMIPVACQARY
jgi:hypothetical protein